MMPRFPFGFPRGPGGRGFDGAIMNWMPAVMGIIIGLAILCAIVLWVIRSIGLMRMAKKLGFPDPWLAWIPGAGEYLFVKLAGERQRKLGIAYMFVQFFGILAGVLIMALGCIPIMMSGAALNGGYYGMMGMMGSAALGFLPGFLFLSLALIAAAVLRLILTYHIYKRFKPNQAVLFLVLSIFFNFLGPIFLLVASFGEPDGEGKCCSCDATPPEPPTDV